MMWRCANSRDYLNLSNDKPEVFHVIFCTYHIMLSSIPLRRMHINKQGWEKVKRYLIIK